MVSFAARLTRTARSSRLAAAFVAPLVAAALAAQTPTPSPAARIPGTNLYRCATPIQPAGSGFAPADCSYTQTNPLPIYAPSDLITIPVVVHVIQNSSGTGNLSDAVVQSQIDVLNEDFRAQPGTPGAGGVDTRIEFRLATVDPNGNPTNGIRHYTNDTWWNDVGAYWNALAWPTDRYLNIYTNNTGAGSTLGFVPDLPQGGSVLGTPADRVVILYSAFGRPGQLAPYDQGRTTTHEVGHYLGLFHTFDNGCDTASCNGSGDLICDTEAESAPRFGCPASATSCGTPDPVHNFMDYTDDGCMTGFTPEQARRMRCTLQSFRPLLGATIAVATSFGTGCYDRPATVAQTFGGGAFDLANGPVPAVIEFQPQADGYQVHAAASAWFSPTSPDLGLGDDSLVTCNLPFVFPHPGGSTSVVRLAANGFVWLDGTSTDVGPIAAGVLLANGAARFAPLWMDLDPSLGGSCHFDVDPSGTAVYLTWLDVPAGIGGAGNTAQLALRADGTAQFRYQAVPNQPSLCAVGYTMGFTAAPANLDLSTALPVVVGPVASRLTWEALDRPIVGTAPSMMLGNLVNPATSIGMSLIGWQQQPSPFDLGMVGAPGCALLIDVDLIDFFLVSGASTSWTLPLPASQAIVGVEFFTQGALLTQGFNELGLLTANAVRLVVGNL